MAKSHDRIVETRTWCLCYSLYVPAIKQQTQKPDVSGTANSVSGKNAFLWSSSPLLLTLSAYETTKESTIKKRQRSTHAFLFLEQQLVSVWDHQKLSALQ